MSTRSTLIPTTRSCFDPRRGVTIAEPRISGSRWRFTGRSTTALPGKNLLRVITARRNARIASAVLATAIPSVRPSVGLSVCHTPVLCQNDGT